MQMREKSVVKTGSLSTATRLAVWQQHLKSEPKKLSNQTGFWLFPSSGVATALLLLVCQPVQVCLFIRLRSQPGMIARRCLQMRAALVLGVEYLWHPVTREFIVWCTPADTASASARTQGPHTERQRGLELDGGVEEKQDCLFHLSHSVF